MTGIPRPDAWGEQLDGWLIHRDYRAYAHEFLLAELPSPGQGALMVDIGCGDGALLEAARERGYVILGIDLSPAVLTHHAVRTSVPFVAGDALDIPLTEGRADLSICHGLYEHLDSPAAGLAELLRVTRPGGRAIVSVPARWSLFPLLVPIWYFTGGRWRHGWRSMVGRTYSAATFRSLLEGAGWEVEAIRRFKAGSLLDWARIPFRESAARTLESSPLLRALFGLMLSARCRRPVRKEPGQ